MTGAEDGLHDCAARVLRQERRTQVNEVAPHEEWACNTSFEVAGGDEFEELWAAERTAAGGFYDPLTGRPDLGRIGSARARILAALRQRADVSG